MKKWIIVALLLPVVAYVSYKAYRYTKHKMIEQEIDIEYLDKPAPDAQGRTLTGAMWSLKD